MMAAVDQRVHPDVRLAFEDALGLDHPGGDDDDGYDDGGYDDDRHRQYASRRSMLAHFLSLRSHCLTWSPREARSHRCRLPRHLGHVRRT